MIICNVPFTCSGPTTYTLGLHFFHKNHPPALTRNEDPICSTTPIMARNWQLVCTGARVLSPHSCIMTANFVISIIHENSVHKLCLYSILDDSCGVCLRSFLLARGQFSVICCYSYGLFFIQITW